MKMKLEQALLVKEVFDNKMAMEVISCQWHFMHTASKKSLAVNETHKEFQKIVHDM